MKNRVRIARAFLFALVLALLCGAAPRPAAAYDSIVVPPFRNLTGEERIGWIGEGFSRTLTEKFNRIVDLTAIHLRVRQTVSNDGTVDLAAFLDGPGVPAAETALFGAVIKGGDVEDLDSPLEVTVRLVDLRTTEQIAALEIRGLMKQIFSLEADLAAEVAGKLGIRLTPAEKQALRTQETRSLQAYKETVLGTVFLEDGAYDSAIEMFEEAMRHNPGIFYPKAHNLLGRAYQLSGRKKEMLTRFKKDAAEISQVYFNLAVAQEFGGKPGEAEKNYGLFLKYTDRRILNWRMLRPGLAVGAAREDGFILRENGGGAQLMDWKSGVAAEATAQEEPPVEGPDRAGTIPPAEREMLTTPVSDDGDRLYYGLRNGYVIGRSSESGKRTWAYRLRGIPTGRIALAGGHLAVADDRGFVYSLGLHKGTEALDLAAYLKLAELAMRRNEKENAEEIYRHIVEEVKFNVPSAWHFLWEMAEARGDKVAAAYRWDNYQLSQY